MNKYDNPYDILGVNKDSDESTIKKAYFQLARQYHPDRQETEEEKQRVNSKFAEISDAYDILTDPVRKNVWEKANRQRQNRPRSRSPMYQAQAQSRRPSGIRSTPGGTGSHQRHKQHPMYQRKTPLSPPRIPPRHVWTAKRSVSPVPQRVNRSLGPAQRRSSRTRQSLSPMAHRSRRNTSPRTPRKSQASSKQSPGSLRRRSCNPYSPQKPQKAQAVRRASSGPIVGPPISSIAFGVRQEDLRNEKPRSYTRASWSSSSSLNNPDYNKTENPFQVLGLHHKPDNVEIITAYREKTQEYHPSKTYATEKDRQEAAREMAKITWAYEILRDSKQLEEWQEKSKSKNESQGRFHDSISSRGSWFTRLNRSTKSSPDDEDDDDSFIGDDERHINSTIDSSQRSIRRLGGKTSSTSPKSQDKKKVSLLATLGFPAGLRGKESSTPKPEATDGELEKNKQGSMFTNAGRIFTSKNDSPITPSENAPEKIEIDTTPKADELLPRTKTKKKKKKKRVSKLDVGVGEDDHVAKPKKTKKKRKKKKKQHKSPPDPIDYTWRREESKRVLEGSNRTARETVEGSFGSFDAEHLIVALAE